MSAQHFVAIHLVIIEILQDSLTAHNWLKHDLNGHALDFVLYFTLFEHCDLIWYIYNCNVVML